MFTRFSGVISLFVVVVWGSLGCGGHQRAPRPPAASADARLPRERQPSFRLPTGVAPTAYRIHLKVDPSTNTFGGDVEIDVTTVRPRSSIFLHGVDLRVQSVDVVRRDGNVARARYAQVTPEGLSVVTLDKPVAAGVFTLRFRYEADFSRKILGLYRVDQADRSYAFTQFESTSARLAFPCFDEPSFKTPFQISLTVRKGESAIANTTARAERPLAGGFKRVDFATTPKLPTYLIAWAVGDFDVVDANPIPSSSVRSKPIPFRAIVTKGRRNETGYALANTPAILLALERYFGIAYPFDKLDIIAVPDFGATAMENAGAITFRDWLILIGENATENQRRLFAEVMSHELAHQWFGNLATMKWWDDLWLNESFASWAAPRVTEELFPENKEDLVTLVAVQYAMQSDSLPSARQIRRPIERHQDIQGAFDAITYGKGGGVLTMFDRFLGNATFQKGVRTYLKQHAFGSATTDDFLSALTQAAGWDVGSSFRTFLFQPGVPFVRTRLRCESNRAFIDYEQSRYLPIGSKAESKMTWQVPMCVRFGDENATRASCVLAKDAKGTFALETDSCPRWVLPNADAAGYYRFGMTRSDLVRLRAEGWGKLSEREKLAVFDAVEAAFDSGDLEARDAFDELSHFAGDESRTISLSPTSLLRFLRNHVVDPSLRPKVDAFISELYRKRFFSIGGFTASARDSGERKVLRQRLAELLALVARDKTVRADALRLGSRLLASRKGLADARFIAPELFATILSVTVQERGKPAFDWLVREFEQTEDSVLRMNILRALGSVTDPNVAKDARDFALNPSVRVNEATLPLRYQIHAPETRADAWAWLRTHLAELEKRLPGDDVAKLAGLAGELCSAEGAQQARELFQERLEPLPGGPQYLRSALESLALCAARAAAHKPATEAFFRAR